MTDVVPLVDRLGGVDPLVALQADELATGPRPQGLGHLGLADPGLTLEQQGTHQAESQVDGRAQPPVGQVVLGGQLLDDLVHRGHVSDGHAVRLRPPAPQRPQSDP